MNSCGCLGSAAVCRIGVAVLGFLSAAGMARAADYVLTVDPNRSTVTLRVDGLGTSDSDSSQVGGTIHATLTPSSGPFDTIHITGLALDVLEQINIDLTQPFLGGVVATGDNIALRIDDNNGLAGPETTVAADGSFVQVDNLVQALGTLNYVGTGILGGSIGSGSVELVSLPPFDADFAGTVVDDGTTVTLSIPVMIEQEFEISGVTFVIALNGGVVATAATMEDVPGDLDGDGCVGFADLVILLGDYGCTGGSCVGDVDGDGSTGFGDLVILLGNYGVGCP